MDNLDKKIQQLLENASEATPFTDEPSLIEELILTFKGRHRALMIPTAIKMISAGLIFYFCIYQFFQQETTMAMMAYATAALIALIVAASTLLFFWIQLNHNTTVREIKRVDLRCAMILRALEEQNNHLTEQAKS